MQKLALRQYTRRPTCLTVIVCAAIGLAIGFLPPLAASLWAFWMEGGIAFGVGPRPLLILEDNQFAWAIALFAAAIVAATTLLFAMNQRIIIQRIFNVWRRDMPYWTLEVAESGLRMEWNKVSMTAPWSDVRGLQSNKTATFLTFDAYYKAVGVSHTAFASPEDRAACLAFIRSKVTTA